MTFHIITFGCQMNRADSDLVAGLLARGGWQPCDAVTEADLILINTCSVRERPEHKVLSLLGELRQWKSASPGRVLAVAGCMAQRAADTIIRRAPHVDIVMGTGAFHRIEELLDRVQQGERPVVALEMRGRATDRPGEAAVMQADGEGCSTGPGLPPLAPALRAFVPIIRGCTNFCSYCIVPFVRGPEISRSLEEIVGEVECLVAAGTREITLLGQNVLAYGADRSRPPLSKRGSGDGPFAQLLRRLSAIEDLWRIRFTTCHPRDVASDLIAAMADLPKVCEHIHLPIQAGTDRLLSEMKRGYTTDHYLRLVAELRSRVPGISVTTDIMVGFPGETEEDFEQSLSLYRQIRFDSAFMFAFSPRPGTAAAARADQIPRPVRLARLSRLIEVQNQITLEINRAEVGEEAELLVDGPAAHGDGLLAGRARNNKQVIFPGDSSLSGCLVAVRLTKAHLWGFTGELLRVLARPG